MPVSAPCAQSYFSYDPSLFSLRSLDYDCESQQCAAHAVKQRRCAMCKGICKRSSKLRNSTAHTSRVGHQLVCATCAHRDQDCSCDAAHPKSGSRSPRTAFDRIDAHLIWDWQSLTWMERCRQSSASAKSAIHTGARTGAWASLGRLGFSDSTLGPRHLATVTAYKCAVGSAVVAAKREGRCSGATKWQRLWPMTKHLAAIKSTARQHCHLIIAGRHTTSSSALELL